MCTATLNLFIIHKYFVCKFYLKKLLFSSLICIVPISNRYQVNDEVLKTKDCTNRVWFIISSASLLYQLKHSENNDDMPDLVIIWKWHSNQPNYFHSCVSFSTKSIQTTFRLKQTFSLMFLQDKFLNKNDLIDWYVFLIPK